MSYTIRVYNKVKRIQESVDIEKVELYVDALSTMDNYLTDLNFHSEDGLSRKDLLVLENKAGELVAQIDRFKLFFSDSAFSEQDELKKQLKDCIARCQNWVDVQTDNSGARVDEYIQHVLEASAPEIHKQIDKVIAEIRHSSITK